jgi:hypothetical protein
MSENWLYNIKHVTPGEPVQAGVVSRPDQALQDRTEYLRQRLDAAELGKAIFDTGATVAPDVQPGHAVYWNYTTKQYEKALAAVELNEESQTYTVLPSSDCVGLCCRKINETLGDIVLNGIVTLPEIANSVVGTLTPGRYYLSAAEPGKLVKQKPGVTVSVCYVQGATDTCNPAPRVVVMPNTRELIDEHTHYRFELVARPAGNNQIVVDGDSNERHEIGNADSDLPGWLPFDDAVFNGKAPAGAVFGYNLSRHPALNSVWPPLPVQSVAVLVDKATSYAGATEVPTGPDGLVICDLHGIWWMSDCRGDVPWPENYSGTPEEDTVITETECPRAESMRVVVVFIRMLVGNDRSLVTSLIPGTDSPVQIITCATGLPATAANPGTGDLELNLSLQYAVDNDARDDANTPAEQGLIVTGKTPSGRRLQRGWVAGGIVAHNLPQVSVSSTNQRNLTTAEKTALALPTGATVQLHRGLVKLNFDVLADKELTPQIIRLNDTVERLYNDIPYLGFPAGQASSMRLRFNVPDANIGTGVLMRVRLQLFGKGTQTMPALYMSYRKLQKPGTTPTTAISLLNTDTPLNIDTALAVSANAAIVRDSEAFSVTAGDTVLVTIGRTAGDTYPEVGVLRVAGILSLT